MFFDALIPSKGEISQSSTVLLHETLSMCLVPVISDDILL